MRNTQCQVRLSVIHPPSTGPIAGAETTVSPYRAKAWARWRAGKLSANIACSVGPSPPPPIPCASRATTIQVNEVDAAQATEARVNMATQLM